MHASRSAMFNALAISCASGLLLAACDRQTVDTSLGGPPSATQTAQAGAPRKAATPAPQDTAKQEQVRRLEADRLLAAKIREAFRNDPELNNMAVDASVRDGVVTLHGTARNLARRERAMRLVLGIEGVRSVDNGLIVLAGS